MEEKRSIWCRIGVSLYGTKEEINDLIVNGNVGKILERGDFCFDGDAVIPGCCVEDYNETYDENYEVDDVYF